MSSLKYKGFSATYSIDKGVIKIDCPEYLGIKDFYIKFEGGDYDQIEDMIKDHINKYLLWEKLRYKKIDKMRLFNISINFGGDM